MKPLALLAAFAVPAVVIAAPSPSADGVDFSDAALAELKLLTSAYAPKPAACPSTPLVRSASAGVSAQEAKYVAHRKILTDYAMELFLLKTGVKFPALKDYPTAALLTSGGGFRSMLTGAGVVKAFDGREGLQKYPTAGLYQAMTYQAGLSGGGWLLSSMAANDYPTITDVYNKLWKAALASGPISPGGGDETAAYAQITADVAAKLAAGFNVSIVDPYGREVAYEILYGADGGASHHLSDVLASANFTKGLAPFPIITATGVDVLKGECAIMDNATQWEFSPVEFGSWNKGIASFASTKYLGSALSGGKPVKAGACVVGFDEASFVLGTSSDIYPAVTCPTDSFSPNMSTSPPLDLLPLSARGEMSEVFALVPNPFYKLAGAPAVSAQTQLTLADGGLSNQNNPVWPFLFRPNVSVLLVNDNSADTSKNYPNGTELHVTYLESQLAGLGDRMPVIPGPDVFAARNLSSRPTVFGCNSANPGTLLIVWIPNVGYNGFNSGVSTFMLAFSAAQSAALIDNGALVGSYGQAKGFDVCMGCFIVKKQAAAEGAKLPSECQSCFSKFCYN